MLREPAGRLLTAFEPLRAAPSEAPTPESLGRLLRALPWALFLFLYLPMVYWSGFALKANWVLDYPSFYVAARLALVEGSTPYGFGALDDYSIAMDRWLPPFVYPPPSLLAFWPLTVFRLEHAFVLFTIVSHLCLLGTMWLILTRLISLPEQRQLRTLALCLCVGYMLLSDAVPATLNLGQINIIAGFFVCLSLTALVEDKPAWRIALPLCLAILLKTYPVLLLILLVTRGKYRAAALTVGCYGLFVAAAAVLLPAEVWTSWRTQVLPAAVVSKDEAVLFSHSNVSFVWNQSITGFFTKLFGDRTQTKAPLYLPGLATPVAHFFSAALMALTSWLAFRAWRRGPRIGNALDDIAAFLLMVYLVAPVSWDHHLVFVLPSAVLALTLILNGAARGRTGTVLAIALCLIAWRMNLDLPLFSKHWWTLLASLKFYAVMALWVFFARRLYAAGRPVETT